MPTEFDVDEKLTVAKSNPNGIEITEGKITSNGSFNIEGKSISLVTESIDTKGNINMKNDSDIIEEGKTPRLILNAKQNNQIKGLAAIGLRQTGDKPYLLMEGAWDGTGIEHQRPRRTCISGDLLVKGSDESRDTRIILTDETDQESRGTASIDLTKVDGEPSLLIEGAYDRDAPVNQRQRRTCISGDLLVKEYNNLLGSLKSDRANFDTLYVQKNITSEEGIIRVGKGNIQVDDGNIIIKGSIKSKNNQPVSAVPSIIVKAESDPIDEIPPPGVIILNDVYITRIKAGRTNVVKR
ncbi:MAG: hypothetical protein WBX01_13265 [Nitrososphaeraceae archaeon]